VIGGYQFTHVAGYQANIVLKKCFISCPVLKISSNSVGRHLLIKNLLVLAWQNKEARERYGDDIYVVKQGFDEVDRAQAEAATAGFAKIITKRNGQILSAHLVKAICW